MKCSFEILLVPILKKMFFFFENVTFWRRRVFLHSNKVRFIKVLPYKYDVGNVKKLVEQMGSIYYHRNKTYNIL